MRKKSQSYGRTDGRGVKLVRHVRQLRARAERLGRALVRWESKTKFASMTHGLESVAPSVTGRIVILCHAKTWSRSDVECAVYALERQGCPWDEDTLFRVLLRERGSGPGAERNRHVKRQRRATLRRPQDPTVVEL